MKYKHLSFKKKKRPRTTAMLAHRQKKYLEVAKNNSPTDIEKSLTEERESISSEASLQEEMVLFPSALKTNFDPIASTKILMEHSNSNESSFDASEPNWRDIASTDEQEKHGFLHEEAVPLIGKRLDEWLLVLAAKDFPHHFSRSGNTVHIEVPSPLVDEALTEIKEYESESTLQQIVVTPKNSIVSLFIVLLFLIVWHGLRNGWFIYFLPSPPFPLFASSWPAAFGLDTYRVVVDNEWWRAVTALTIHKDSIHLASNVCFALIFMGQLLRRTGGGLGLFMVFLAASIANACNALFRSSNIISIGFSTAVFTSIGLLAVFAGLDYYFRSGGKKGSSYPWGKSLFLPLAAGFALLAFLGGASGKDIDFAAHAWGGISGVVIGGLLYQFDIFLLKLTERKQKLLQSILFVVIVLMVVLAWFVALLYYNKTTSNF